MEAAVTVREAFVLLCRAQWGRVVVMQGSMPDGLDCSEMIAWALGAMGCADMRGTHTAQRFHDESPALETFSEPPLALPGDLCFYGVDAGHVSHVAVYDGRGGCISADGATWSVKTVEIAKTIPGARVRNHHDWRFRRDLPYASLHRNTWLDALELGHPK
jgi:cell wall-associated NlpC family hydrolase